MTYDIIGDIHGHAEELRILLRQLGYEERVRPDHLVIANRDYSANQFYGMNKVSDESS